MLAFTNPQARVLGIDVSQAALQHQHRLKQRYGLDNLALEHRSITTCASLDREFDLIVSTGVLHHLDDPTAALRLLGDRLKPDGCMGLMLYARYGRFGVEMLQQLFRELNLQANAEDLAVIRSCLTHTDPDHPLRGYQSVADDLDQPAGLVDTFLPKRERSYTVEDCLNLVAAAGLQFQDWLFKTPYYPPSPRQPGDPFLATIATLPIAQQWGVMERLHTRNACHVFMVCRPERTLPVLNFESAEARHVVPALRRPFQLDGNQLHRNGQPVPLSAKTQALIQAINGHQSIAEICQSWPQIDPSTIVRQLAELWRLDVIAITHPAARGQRI